MDKIKLGVVSLGCDKNRVDTEVMISNLLGANFELCADASEAEVIVINTCAFLESSRKEAIDTVIEMSQYKTNGNCKKIVVTGCLSQKFGEELKQYLTEADIIVGINQYDKIAEIINNSLNTDQRIFDVCPNGKQITQGKRVLTTPSHYAYIKIADGCDNFCSYCLIPYIRGRFRSRTIESIVDEAQALASGGVKEIILVAQDVTKYGTDLYGSARIVELIQQLSLIPDIRWIRLLYCYPELVTQPLIEQIVSNEKVVKYLDVPLQHVDDMILRKMNRRCTEQQVYQLFDQLNNCGIDARTTFICGFPFETAETHKKVEQFLQKYKLRNVGFFAYSREQGTAAANMDSQVPEKHKQQMVKHLYEVQHNILYQRNRNDIGKTYSCIVDNMVEQQEQQFVYIGRTQFMSPEIDGVVYIHSAQPLNNGSFVDVKITDVADYDLIGEAQL